MKAAVAPKARTATASLLLLVLVNILNFYDRHVPGALAEPIRKEFGLTDSQVGLLGTAFVWLYAIIGLPFGFLADKYSRKKLLSAGVAVWGLLTALAGWARTYSFLLVSRLGVAVGEAACAPTATSWIGDLYPAEPRSKPLALFMLGVPIGGALSYFFSGPIALAYGWRRAMLLAGIPALLLAPVVLFMNEPERGASERRGAWISDSPWQVLRVPTFWLIIVSGALVNFNLYAVATFLPAFFSRVHHVNVGRAGVLTGVVYAVGGLLGGTLGGLWGDIIVRRRRTSGRLQLAAVAALAAVPLSYLGVRQQLGALAWAVPLFALAYGLLNMYYGLVYASIQDIVAPALRGTSMAIYFMFMYMGGAAFGPLFTGKLSDAMARKAAAAAGSASVTEPFRAIGLQQAMLVVPLLAFALAVVLWLGSRTMARDARTSI